MDDASMVAVAGAYLAVMAIAAIVYWVIQIIAYWKMFEKAGEPGWKSIIPVYNGYVLYKITWNVIMFFVALALGIASACLSSASADNAVLNILGYICWVASVVITIILNYKTSKAYGHGIGYTIGLTLLNPIFILIIGLGSSQYIGKDGQSA